MTQGFASISAIFTKQKLLEYFSSLKELEEVERLIKSKFASEAPLLAEISSYLLTLGGKRIRPVLALIVAKAFCTPEPMSQHKQGLQLLQAAAGIELIHMATLMHDDIIDKSPLRRHQASPFIKYGADATLLTGDFLLVRAFGLCSHLDPFIINATETACVALTEGEVLETPLYKQRHSLETNLLIASKKTASLFCLAAQTAAFLAGAPEAAWSNMALYGEKLGIAYQVLDDILDVTSSETSLGKKIGQDIHERKPSVINVLWLDTGSVLAKQLLTPPGGDEEDYIKKALAEIKASPVLEQAKKIATQYGEEALSALDAAVCSSSNVSDQAIAALQALVAYAIERLN